MGLQQSAETNGKQFMIHPKLGFLGTCPSNLGTGLRGGVMIKLPEFNKNVALLDEVCSNLQLQPRGSSGEHSEAVGAKFDISNKQRIGFSEVC
jgi:creatine kinase